MTTTTRRDPAGLLEQLAPLCQATVPAELLELRAAGAAVPPDQRRELLRAVRAGEIVDLEIDIIASREPIKPRPLPERMSALANANFARFHLPEYEALGKSFAKRPFLRDHSWMHADRGGRITKSSAALEGDAWVLRQTVQIVKPWAAEDVLDGTMETFSIGWKPKRAGWAGFKLSAWCTVCDALMFGAPPAGQQMCLHWPGDIVKPASNDERVIVELEWRNVIGRETSAVTFPAVEGTGIEDVVSALSELRDIGTRTGARGMDPRLAKLLGLGEGATLDDAIAAIESLSTSSARIAGLELELAAVTEARDAARTSLQTERTRQAEAQQAADATELGQLRERALDGGLWVANDKRAKLFEQLAAAGVDQARQFVESLEPAIPVGQPLQSERGGGNRTRRGPRGLSERERRYCRERGLTEEKFLELQQDDGDKIDEDDEAAA